MLTSQPDVIVSFGDSLSDAGVAAGLTDQILTTPIPFGVPPVVGEGYAGGFSNGDVYTQIFPDLLGARHLGYAIGGAEALKSETIDSNLGGTEAFVDPNVDPALDAEIRAFEISFEAQIDRFITGQAAFPGGQSAETQDDETVAAMVFIGLNDIARFGDEANFSSPLIFTRAIRFLDDLEDTIQEKVDDLAASGLVDQIIIAAPPSLSFFPGAEDASDLQEDLADLLIEEYSDRLVTVVNKVDGDNGVEAKHLDFDPLSDAILADERSFGLTEAGPYYPDPSSFDVGPVDPQTGLPSVTFEVNPDVADVPLSQVRYFDPVHFSAATHEIFAAYTTAMLTHVLTVLDNDGDGGSFKAAADFALGGNGDDTVAMRLGADIAVLGRGDDFANGGFGSDLLAGGSGADRLIAGPGFDVVAPGLGDDIASGGRGRDLFITGQGSDTLRGGNDRDTFVYVDTALTGIGTAGATQINGGNASDVLVVITDEPTARAVRQELAGLSDAVRDSGTFTLETLDISLVDVERFQIRGGGLDAIDKVGAANPALFEQADLWGFI